ncbi:MAG: terminase small subunit [bacterium]|nr:terminase small subunit [bacterium]
MPDKLTPKQKLFCLEYLKDLNATRSALDAGYSEKTAEVIGWENLRKPLIADYIQKKNQERFDNLESEGKKVIYELALVGFSDIKDYVDIDEEGCVKCKSIEEMKNTRVISSVKEKRTIRQSPGESEDMILDNTFEFKMHDKMKALEGLAKHYGLYKDDINLKTGPIVIKMSKEDEDI